MADTMELNELASPPSDVFPAMEKQGVVAIRPVPVVVGLPHPVGNVPSIRGTPCQGIGTWHCADTCMCGIVIGVSYTLVTWTP